VRTWNFAFGVALILFATRAAAWGSLGHQLITELALRRVPPESPVGQLLGRSPKLALRYAITPDIDWKDFGQLADPQLEQLRHSFSGEEKALHFFQIDAFLPNGDPTPEAVAALPTDPEYAHDVPAFEGLLKHNAGFLRSVGAREAADAVNPQPEAIARNGTLPFRVLQLRALGVAAWRRGDFRAAALYWGTLAHYVGDGFQPFHATYLFNPGGIHRVYEETILEAHAEGLGEREDPASQLWDTRRYAAELDAGVRPEPPTGEVVGLKGLYAAIAVGLKHRDPLIRAFERAKQAHPGAMGRSAAAVTHSAHHPAFSKAVVADFSASRISVPGAGDMTVLQSAERRIEQAAARLAAIWAAAGAEALAGNPGAKAPGENAAFDVAYTIRNYPHPTYLTGR
jgi:hypothetical protein